MNTEKNLLQEVPMLTKPTDLAAYRHTKHLEMVEAHLELCHSIEVFFGSAHFEMQGCYDRYVVQCDIEQYQRSGEIPDYVLAYLRRLQ